MNLSTAYIGPPFGLGVQINGEMLAAGYGDDIHFHIYRVQLAPDALWFAYIFELVAAAPLGGNLADKFLLALYLADDSTDYLTHPHFG